MDSGITRVYEFGPFRLDPARRLLFRDGVPVSVTGRAIDILVTLIEHRGQVIEKGELMRLVWHDLIVQEANLSQNVFVLRKVLGERPSDHHYIVTVPGIGYRFVADVRDVRPEPVRQEVLSAAARRQIRSIAVVPFRTTERTEEHLGLGLADAVITRLSGLRQLAVRPTAPARAQDTADPIALGRMLGVDALVLGAVKRAGDRIRVTVQFVAVAHAATLWAHQFDEDLTDLFSVEDSIADHVKRALVLELTDAEHTALTKRHTANTEAYQAYLKGRFFWNKRTPEGFRRAIECFGDTIARDPNYALAYAGVADCHNLLSVYGAGAPADGFPQAMAAAAAALALDEGLAEAHVALAYARLNYYWDFSGATREFRRALELMPNYATAHHLYADLLTATGRFADALTEIRRAQELDPVSLIINTDIGWALLHARRYDAAIQQLRETIELDPGLWYAHWVLGLNYEQQGLYEEAIDAFHRTITLSPDHPWAVAGLGRAYAAAHQRADAHWALDRLVVLSTQRYVSPYMVATVHAALGEADQAFACLDRAYDEGSHWLMYVNIAQLLDSLRPDPRFDVLVRRVRERSESGTGDRAHAS